MGDEKAEKGNVKFLEHQIGSEYAIQFSNLRSRLDKMSLPSRLRVKSTGFKASFLSCLEFMQSQLSYSSNSKSVSGL
jgi:hypothetical protein